MWNDVIEFYFIVKNILLTNLAHLPVTPYNLKHDVSGDCAMYATILLRLGERLRGKKHGTDVSKYTTG